MTQSKFVAPIITSQRTKDYYCLLQNKMHDRLKLVSWSVFLYLSFSIFKVGRNGGALFAAHYSRNVLSWRVLKSQNCFESAYLGNLQSTATHTTAVISKSLSTKYIFGLLSKSLVCSLVPIDTENYDWFQERIKYSTGVIKGIMSFM